MNNLFQNNYESDNDERLDKKFSYNYQVIKRMYPKASELPEEEVRGIIRKYYQAPKGQEEQVIKDYISQKEPEWQTKYFAEDDENNTLLSPITRMRRQRAKGFLHQSSPETSNMLMDYQALDTSDMLYGAATNNNYQMQKDKEENVDSMPQSSDSAKSFGDYFMDNVADIGYGMKKALSGATLGASDWALRRLGLDNEQEYLAKKQAEGLGGLTKGLGVASEIGGNILGAGGALAKGLQNAGFNGLRLATTAGGTEGAAYGLTGSDRLADAPENMAWGAGLGAGMGASMPYLLKPIGAAMRPAVNRINRYMGKRVLTKQLQRGTDFQDVKLGNISDDLANKINNVRNAEGISVVDNTKSIIPANRVEHIRQRRVTNDGYAPQDAAKTVDMALFSKDPRVIKGNVPENQVVFDASNPANKVVINKHPETKGISVVTTMKDKSLGKINKRLGGLPFPPYGANITSDVSTAAGSKIPDFQPLNKNITLSQTDVNPFEKRSFVEALADRDKARVMRNGVLSGASDLSERARILQDNLTKRKDGWFDADFEKLIKTPEMAKAEVQYAQFMAKNGQKTLSPQKVSDFYGQHPIAKDMIAEMREVDPRAFDNILPGSLEEFDMLKKNLREEAGNKIKVGASKSSALKRAENALKELMDGEFPGFKDVNTQYASAQTAQDIFESKLRQGLTSVGGGTANTSPFWSGISSPLTAAGVIGGYFNPSALALTAAGLGGKALMRSSRRAAARRLADGIVRTPVNINPVFANGLSAPALNALSKYQNRQDY